MAFDPLPQSHITGLDIVSGGSTVPGTDTDKYLLIPRTSIPELDEAECDEVTGDIRKVALALEDMLFNVYNGMDAADRPANWRHSRSTSPNDAAGTSTRSYYATFVTTFPSVEVADEPAGPDEPA